jgi:HAD superfamily hydrolase (TIGR01509 family)
MCSAGAEVAVGRPQAFLVDVYETILTCDFEVLRNELPVIAGAEPHVWGAAFARAVPDLAHGRLAMAQAFEQILAACDIRPSPALVRELVRKDRELLAASSRLYDDAIPFLQMLRSSGVRVALVSNCIENTRPLPADLGISSLADAVVLSCEVGWAKPDPRIYRRALDQLGVIPSAAVFVDDQSACCAGAAAEGITALQIARGRAPLPAPVPGTQVIGSLLDVALMLSGR